MALSVPAAAMEPVVAAVAREEQWDKWIVDRDLRHAFEDNYLVDFLGVQGEQRLAEDSKRRHLEAKRRHPDDMPPPEIKRDDDDIDNYDPNMEFSTMIVGQAAKLRRTFVKHWYAKLKNERETWRDWADAAFAPVLPTPVVEIRKSTHWPPTGDLFPDLVQDKSDVRAAIRVWHELTVAAMNHGVPLITNGVLRNFETKVVTLPIMLVREDVLHLLVGDIDNRSAVEQSRTPFQEYRGHQDAYWRRLQKSDRGDSKGESKARDDHAGNHCPIPYCVVIPRFNVLEVVEYAIAPIVDDDELAEMSKEEQKEAKQKIKGQRLSGNKSYAWYRAVACLQAAAVDDVLKRQREGVHYACCGVHKRDTARAPWKNQQTQAYMVGRGHKQTVKGVRFKSTVAGAICLALTDGGPEYSKNKIAMIRAVQWWSRLRAPDQGGKWVLYPKPSVPELYPNMKASRTDSPWSSFKAKYAKWLRELTSVWYVGYHMREYARRHHGVVAYDDPRMSLEVLGRCRGFDAQTLGHMIALNQRCVRAIVVPQPTPAGKEAKFSDAGDDKKSGLEAKHVHARNGKEAKVSIRDDLKSSLLKRKRSEEEVELDEDDDNEPLERAAKRSRFNRDGPVISDLEDDDNNDDDFEDSGWALVAAPPESKSSALPAPSAASAPKADAVASFPGMNFPLVSTVQPMHFKSNKFDWRRDPAILYRDYMEAIAVSAIGDSLEPAADAVIDAAVPHPDDDDVGRARPEDDSASLAAGAARGAGVEADPVALAMAAGPPPMVEVYVDFENMSNIADGLDKFPQMDDTTRVPMIGITWWDHVKQRKITRQLVAHTALGKRAAAHELQLFYEWYHLLEKIATDTYAAVVKLKSDATGGDEGDRGELKSLAARRGDAAGTGAGAASGEAPAVPEPFLYTESSLSRSILGASDDDSDSVASAGSGSGSGSMDLGGRSVAVDASIVPRSASSSVIPSVAGHKNIKIKVWHYSNAEVVLLNGVLQRLRKEHDGFVRRLRGDHLCPDDVHRQRLVAFADRIIWCDMIMLLKDERFLIRGMLNYGLKSVIRAAHKQGSRPRSTVDFQPWWRSFDVPSGSKKRREKVILVCSSSMHLICVT
jgi:hypothetical protein